MDYKWTISGIKAAEITAIIYNQKNVEGSGRPELLLCRKIVANYRTYR